MMKSLLVAIWCCLVVGGSSFGAAYVMKMKPDKQPASAAAFETRKTRELNVPIVRDGAVKGYVVVMLNYVVDLAAAKNLPVPPDAFVTDETFQYIYSDDKIDFAHLDKLDLGKMTETLVDRINTRLRANVVTDMGVIECNFLLNTEKSNKKL